MTSSPRFPISVEPPLSPADRLQIAFDLYDVARDLKRESLRRAHPSASDDDLEQLLFAWHLDRPPDGEGVLVSWPRR